MKEYICEEVKGNKAPKPKEMVKKTLMEEIRKWGSISNVRKISSQL